MQSYDGHTPKVWLHLRRVATASHHGFPPWLQTFSFLNHLSWKPHAAEHAWLFHDQPCRGQQVLNWGHHFKTIFQKFIQIFRNFCMESFQSLHSIITSGIPLCWIHCGKESREKRVPWNCKNCHVACHQNSSLQTASAFVSMVHQRHHCVQVWCMPFIHSMAWVNPTVEFPKACQSSFMLFIINGEPIHQECPSSFGKDRLQPAGKKKDWPWYHSGPIPKKTRTSNAADRNIERQSKSRDQLVEVAGPIPGIFPGGNLHQNRRATWATCQKQAISPWAGTTLSFQRASGCCWKWLDKRHADTHDRALSASEGFAAASQWNYPWMNGNLTELGSQAAPVSKCSSSSSTSCCSRSPSSSTCSEAPGLEGVSSTIASLEGR